MVPRPRDRGVTSSPASAPSSTKPMYCKPCHTSYPNTATYHAHLLDSANHFACCICFIDHHTKDGLKRHRTQMHPAEQHLTCPGCKKTFTRVGAVVGHMQNKDCIASRASYIENLRTQNPNNPVILNEIRTAIAEDINTAGAKLHWDDAQVSQSLSRGVSTSSLTSSGPLQNHGTPSVGLQHSGPSASSIDLQYHGHSSPSEDQFLTKFVSNIANAAGEDVDLISFDAPSLVLNASWDQPVADFHATEFPASKKVPGFKLPISETNLTSNPQASLSPLAIVREELNSISTSDVNPPSANIFFGSSNVSSNQASVHPWGNLHSAPASKTLFPEATTTIAPPAPLLENITVTPAPVEPVYGEYHPKNPTFEASRYFSAIARTYKCPHRGCKKSLASLSAFVAHLKSAAHNDRTPGNCPHCLRPFSNATALTQHLESQAIRCNARNLDYAGSIMEDVTQVATTDGFHDDDTVKYKNLTHRFNPEDIIESSRRLAEAKAEDKAEHWTRNPFSDW